MGQLKQKILFTGLRLCGSGIPVKYTEIVKLSKMKQKELQRYQLDKLEKCLLYAYQNVPYYHEIFSKQNIINGERKVNWDQYNQIPKLTKEIIKKNYEQLKSNDTHIKGVYANHSGGSTGIPIEIWQDQEYSDWNIANALFIKSYGGYYLGDRELRLWGSERDLLEGKEKISIRIRNKIYGRIELNSFKMSELDMERYVKTWNQYRPQWVEAYTQAIYEFALYIKKHSCKICTPKGIVTSAGTLYPSMKKVIEETFGCKVFNRYGSREVGGIACSGAGEDALRLSAWNCYVEVLNDDMQPVKEGKSGKIYVTTLNNRVMPLIRYEIGDIAKKIEWDQPPVNYPMPLLHGLEGREMSVVRTKDGKVIPGEFFIHFIGVVYNTGYIDKFQVIQHEYNYLEIKVHIIDEVEFNRMKDKIEEAIRLEMSDQVKIAWTKVEEIPNLKSGKYLYVYSRVTGESV